MLDAAWNWAVCELTMDGWIPAAGGTKRDPWDLRGKVSDMETKIRNYQTRVKSVNQENETLKDTITQNQTREAEIEKELETQRGKIKCVNQSLRDITVVASL